LFINYFFIREWNHYATTILKTINKITEFSIARFRYIKNYKKFQNHYPYQIKEFSIARFRYIKNYKKFQNHYPYQIKEFSIARFRYIKNYKKFQNHYPYQIKEIHTSFISIME
jgi:inorganic pyrophosphatase